MSYKSGMSSNSRMRSRIPKSKSRKLFSKTARRVHRKNVPRSPMRGGIRL